MLFKAVNHVAIIVSDYEVSRDFYVNKLGFEVINEQWREANNDWLIRLMAPSGVELEVFAKSNAPKRITNPEAQGLRHLAFEVEDVDAAVEELSKIGIPCEPVRLDGTHKYTFFKDPDGLPLEIRD